MYIKNVQIDNYGKFHKKEFHFSLGLNVVYGENESGKSTLHSFLKGMLYGMEKQRGRAKVGNYERYEPWNSASYYAGSMEFCLGEKEFVLERNFYHKEKRVRLYNPKEQEELSAEHGDLEMLLGGVGKYTFENTCCIPQAAVVTEEDFAWRMQQELNHILSGGDMGIDVSQAEKTLEKRAREEEQKLKKLRQDRIEEERRLELVRELLQEDVARLQKKLERTKAATGQETIQHQTPKTEKKECFLFRIPIIGAVLKFLFQRFCRKKTEEEKTEMSSKESISVSSKEPGEILLEELEEKQMQLYNLEVEMSEELPKASREAELETTIQSIQLALDTIKSVTKECSSTMKEDVMREISHVFREITGEAYESVELSAQGEWLLRKEDKAHMPWQVSRGTMEQLYFAIRVGAGNYLTQEECLPILLDETFCAYDDVRLGRTLSYLASLPQQVILFTCQTRELSMLDELNIKHNSIKVIS